MEILTKLNVNESTYSLKRNVFCRFEEIFASAREKYPQIGSFILVVDSESLRIISSALKMSDLLKMGVSSIERLELIRKPHPDLHAIYIMSPCTESIQHLISDFNPNAQKVTAIKKKKKNENEVAGEIIMDENQEEDPSSSDAKTKKKKVKKGKEEPPAKSKKDNEEPTHQYSRIHVYFTQTLSKTLLGEMANCAQLMKRIRTMKEFNHDFLFIEQNAFHFQLENSLPILFSQPDSQESELLLHCISDKFLSVIPALLRFHTISLITSQSSMISNRFATFLERRLSEYVVRLRQSENPYFDPTAGDVSIIILDRSIDAVTPLLHDYSYQSMIYDLLEVDTYKHVVEYEKVEQSEEKSSTKQLKKCTSQLSDDFDEVFTKFRYQSITASLSGIKEDFEKHTAAMQKTKAENAPRSIEDVQKIINSYPQYKELLNKYAMHFDLILRCYNRFVKWDLQGNCEFEQAMVTGITDEGVKISSETFFPQLQGLLAKQEMNQSDRLRIVLVAYLTLDLSVDQREKLLKTVELADQKSLKNLQWLGNVFTDPKKGQAAAFSKINQKLVELSMHKYNAYREKNDKCPMCKRIQNELKKKPKKERSEQTNCDECGQLYFEFSVMRHTPLSVLAVHSAIKAVLGDGTSLSSLGFNKKNIGGGGYTNNKNKQHNQEFDSSQKITETATPGSSNQLINGNKDKNKEKERKNNKKSKKEEEQVLGDLHKANEFEKFMKEPQTEEDTDEFKNQKKIIVFFLGGVSFAEIRALRGFQEESYQKTPVIIGSTHILTPHVYLKALLDMRTYG